MTNKQITKFFTAMVVSWLREIAINNVECNKQMTFLDAIEDIRDRASYGLNAYFEDRLNENPAFQESMDLENQINELRAELEEANSADRILHLIENRYDGYDGSFFL